MIYELSADCHYIKHFEEEIQIIASQVMINVRTGSTLRSTVTMEPDACMPLPCNATSMGDWLICETKLALFKH